MESKGRRTAHAGPGAGRALWVLGELVTCKVTAEQTGRAYSLFEVVVGPQGGPPPHVQHEEDECLYVLEGEFELLDGGKTVRATAGSLAYVPRGNLHAYKNVGAEPGRLLVSLTPGGLLESFFEEIGEEAVDASPAPDGSPDVGRIVAVAARYGMEMPPPTA